MLEYDAAHDRLNTVVSWVHPEEVWDAACCPGHQHTFITVHSKGWSTVHRRQQLEPR